MAVLVEADELADPAWKSVAKWAPTALGTSVLAWWLSIWTRAQALITDHVATHGDLPESAVARAALYSNGTEAEQRLSAALDDIAGLYPWGALPLVVAAVLIVSGWLFQRPPTSKRIAIGIAVAILLMAAPLVFLGGSMMTALEILE